jgi:Uma2 family endonuclease
MSAVVKKLLTAEEFWQMLEHENHELIAGELTEVMPRSGEHGETVTELLT